MLHLYSYNSQWNCNRLREAFFQAATPHSEGKSFRIGKGLNKSELNVFLLDYTRLPGIKIPPALPALLF
jgi:hypothetical protein